MAAMLAGCPQSGESVPEPPPKPAERPKSSERIVHLDEDALRDVRITTTQARRRRATEEVTAFGEMKLHDDASADLVSPVAAVVERLHAVTGARVAPGKPLAALRSAEVGRARAEVLSARARGLAAEQHLERQRRVVAEGLAPKREEERARMEAAVAQAELRSALGKLGALGLGLEARKIRPRSPGSSCALRGRGR
jgi:cobalt-zinc-cadmium efflux system membrane fusion protein